MYLVFNGSVRYYNNVGCILFSYVIITQDLSSVQKLQRRLNLLEMDISGHQEQINSLSSQADNFAENRHFDAASIVQRQQELKTRYNSLQEPLKAQKLRLEASLQLQQFFRDVEDEEVWIRERDQLASSTHTGKERALSAK